MSPLTQEYLKTIVSYDKETGVFRWAKGRKGAVCGREAGRLTDQGYVVICIMYKQYRAHRLAWLYEFGEWPENEVDHINGDRADNRISNLRSATHAENRCNSVNYSSNKTGLKGVYFYAAKKKWVAQITRNGVNRYLGIFSCPLEAHAMYCKAGLETNGDFFNPGSKNPPPLPDAQQ